ncbi:hypothetical protein M3Y98_00822000 [Aphelenchoides besseyi]|nr:hypothetical protein M3Y98_00822000 [Aphelenchoides besseyi]KAI6195335.1 hypothetical protein M3Y96_01220200 [Aphelenchoides besseyi]
MSQEFDGRTTEILCSVIKSLAAASAPHGIPIQRVVKIIDFSCNDQLGTRLESYGVVKFLENHIDSSMVTIYQGMLVLSRTLKKD